MDEGDDDTRYTHNSYGVKSGQQGYVDSHWPKFVAHGSADVRSSSDPRYAPEEDDGEEGDELPEEDDEDTEVVSKGKFNNEDDDSDDQTSSLNGDVSEDDEQQQQQQQQQHPKKRKLKSMISNYEFAPRVPASSSAIVSASSARPSGGGRGSLSDWTEHETFVLLDEWGNRFLQLGRKSLRLEEWQEVADKVSQVSKFDRTDTQCRNRLDTLKKKYKKEKARISTTREGPNFAINWVHFKKMDMLMSSPSQQSGLSCGMENGFTKPKVNPKHANGLNAMRDRHGNSVSGERNILDALPPRKRKESKAKTRHGSSFQLLADSVEKISEIYEKIEKSKRQQMIELEKMRMEFQRELEVERRQILEKAQAEIAKIRRGDEEENDASAENVSG